MDDHDELIEGMRTKLRATRLIFYSEIASALEDTFLYSVRLADNIGEISYSEAIEAVRGHFNDKIDAIITGELNAIAKDKLKEN